MVFRSCRLSAGIALGLASWIAAGGGEARQAGDSFLDVVDVRVVNLEVVATDEHGERVTGLGPDDFQLLIDGEEVPIEYFSEIVGGRSVEWVPAALEAAPGVASEPRLVPVSPVAAGDRVVTSYLLFIDEYFTDPWDRNRVLDQIRGDLPALGSGDRFAAVAFTGRRLDLVVDWTGSMDEVDRALADASRRPARFAEVEWAGAPAELRGKLRARQLSKTWRAVGTAMRSFAPAPGRRVLLMMSGGWPIAGGGLLDGTGSDLSRRWFVRADFEQVITTANLTGFTIYPIETPRSDAASRSSKVADEGVRAYDRPRLGGPVGSGDSIADASAEAAPEDRFLTTMEELWLEFLGSGDHERQKEVPLLAVAAGSGGRAWLNADREHALASSVGDTRTYYWLGFGRTSAGDDRVHSVDVIPRRPGVSLRTRKGFRDLSRDAEIDFLVESMLLVESSWSVVKELPLELGEARRAGRGLAELPFSITVPLAEILLAPDGAEFRASLELLIVSLDESGDRSDVGRVPLEWHLTPELAARASVAYDASVRVRRQPQRLVFALYDRLSRKVMASRVDLDL